MLIMDAPMHPSAAGDAKKNTEFELLFVVRFVPLSEHVVYLVKKSPFQVFGGFGLFGAGAWGVGVGDPPLTTEPRRSCMWTAYLV